MLELVVVPFPSSINFQTLRSATSILSRFSDVPPLQGVVRNTLDVSLHVLDHTALMESRFSTMSLLENFFGHSSSRRTEFSFPPSLLVTAASESMSTLFEEQLGSVRRRSLEDRRFERIFPVVDLERGRRSLYLR